MHEWFQLLAREFDGLFEMTGTQAAISETAMRHADATQMQALRDLGVKAATENDFRAATADIDYQASIEIIFE